MKLTTRLHLVLKSKNEWSYTSTPPIHLHSIVLNWSTGTTLPLPFTQDNSTITCIYLNNNDCSGSRSISCNHLSSTGSLKTQSIFYMFTYFLMVLWFFLLVSTQLSHTMEDVSIYSVLNCCVISTWDTEINYIQITVLWVVTSFSDVAGCQHLGGPCYHHLQGHPLDEGNTAMSQPSQLRPESL